MVVLPVLAVSPTLASAHTVSGSVEVSSHTDLNLGSTTRLSDDSDNDARQHRVDKNKDQKTGDIHDKSAASAAFLSAIGAAGAGVVTSVDGSTFTIKSLGTHSTTTVTTNASTTYKVNGVATTSSALKVGSRAFIFGSTDSTGISASLVSILNIGVGFFKHWHWFH